MEQIREKALIRAEAAFIAKQKAENWADTVSEEDCPPLSCLGENF